MSKTMTQGLLRAVLFGAILAQAAPQAGLAAEKPSAPRQDKPSEALAITDPNVVPYGMRVRLTSGTWEYLRLLLRDTFKKWGSPRRDTEGINLLLDPGYDYVNHTAGLLRNTPLQRRWAYSPGFSCTFGDCDGTNVYSVKPGTEQWLQVRKYEAPGGPLGCNANNTVNGNARGFANASLQALNREQGFYVTKEGQCFTEINVCTPGSSQSDISTPHVGHDPGQVCDMAAIDADILGIFAEINLGAFVFPHGGKESMPTKLEPSIDPPDIGVYTGFSQRYGMRGAGSKSTSSGCFLGFCSGSGGNVSAWVASNYPTSANYDPFFVHDKSSGSYFRQGDDQAVYLNIGQMQLQSLHRVGAANIWYQLKDRQSGLCLATQAGGTANDVLLILEACVGTQPVRQMFQYDYSNGNLKVLRDNNRCVSFASASDGASVRLFNCGAGDGTHITAFDRVGESFRNRVDSYAVHAHTSTLTVNQQVYTGVAAQQWELADSGDVSNRWRQFKTDKDGHCAEVNGVNDVIHTACNAASISQYWIYNPIDKSFRSAIDWNQCMDINGGDISNNTKIILWPCHGGTNQQWRIDGNRTIVTMADTNYCLNADTGSSKVQIYEGGLFRDCNNSPNTEEKWTLVPQTLAYGWLRERASTTDRKCLELTGGNLTNGTAVQLATCAAVDRQAWLYDDVTSFFRLKQDPRKCLDHGGNHYAGAPLRIWDCSGANQRFDRQGEAILVRNGFFLTGGASPVTMRQFRTDNSQQFEQINEPYTITYQPHMHDCGDSNGLDKVYSGQLDAGNEPVYFDALTPQCLRPKSYWSATKSRWVPCDPFDTYLADGSFNPDRDDNNLIYPAPFGGQSKTCGVANSIYDPGDSGWYGLKVDSLVLKSDVNPIWADKNSVTLTLSTKDLHLELGFWVDANLIGSVSGLVSDPKRRWALINARLKDLIARPKIKLYSIDNSSCQTADGNCTGYFKPWDNQMRDPDRLIVDVTLTQADIDLNLDEPSFEIVTAPSCFVSVIGICAMTSETLMGTVMGELAPVIKDVLIPLIDDAVRGAVESLPELNTVLGNPMNLERSLVDVGLYATPEEAAYLPDPAPPEPGKRWPVRIFDGPAAGREVTDMRFAMGLKPIAFRPPPVPDGFVTVDTNDPPLPDSIYGVPRLVNPDTSGCFNAKGNVYNHRILASGGSYNYVSSTGVMTLSFNNGGYTDLRAGYVIRDITTNKTAVIKAVGTNSITLPAGMASGFDGGSYEVALGVMYGMTYTLGSTPILVAGQVFRDDSTNKFTKIVEVRGTTLITENYSAADFNTGAFTVFNCSRPSVYPAADEDQEVDEDDYVVTGNYTDPHTGINYAAPRVIPEYWKGPFEAHKRAPAWCATPNELRQFSTPGMMASLYPQSTWLSFDSTYDKKYSNQSAGLKNTVGGWDQLPGNMVLRQNRNDGSTEPNPVSYDFSVHVHQRTLASLLQSVVASGAACLEFASEDTMGAETPWKSLLAVDRFAAFIPELKTLFPGRYVSVRVFPTRAPHVRTGIGSLSFTPRERLRDPVGGPLPISNQPYTLGVAFPDLRIEFWVQDLETQDELPVMTMYWNTVLGFYAKSVRSCYKLDPLYNSSECTSSQVNERTVSGYYELFFDLNAPSLQAAFENGRDGFATGAFTDSKTIGSVRGESPIVIDSTVCQTSQCDLLGLSQAVPTLLSSMLQLFLVARLQFMDMTVDFLYVGADGPSDDGVGGGDYLGLYGRLLGNLNVFDLLGGLSLAPGHDRLPYVSMGGFERELDVVFNSNAPVIPVSLIRQNANASSIDSYSYSIDDGFWHTPVDTASLSLGVLTEGEHKLAIKAINDSNSGAIMQKLPTELRFRVDTLAPEITLGSSKGWGWWRYLPVKIEDLQTPRKLISATYSIDGEKYVDLEDDEVPLRRLSDGRHIVRVKAFDGAGNEANAAREIHVGSSGCNSSGADDSMLAWFAATFAMLAARRWLKRDGRMK